MKKSLVMILSLIAVAMFAGCSNVHDININYTDTSVNRNNDPADTEENNDDVLLEYWTEESVAAESIRDYVETVTDEDSEKFIPVEDRIAVFDLDGTIIGELYPSYFEYMMFIHRALYDEDYDAPDDVADFAHALEDGINSGEIPADSERMHALYSGKAYAGMTVEELQAYTRKFMDSKAEGFNNLTRGEAFYKPMVSLVEYLDANDFTCYIVSGSNRIVIRELIKDKLPIPEERVIGMSYTMVASGQEDTDGLEYLYTEDDEVLISDDLVIKTIKMNKVSEIALEIGKVPVLAFGNSTGDLSMCQYTVNNDKYEGKAYLVLCDDFEREYGNYDKYKSLAEFCDEHGFETISMYEDFETIYGDDVTLNLEAENVIFDIKMPEELEGKYVIESRRNGYIVSDKEAKEADFGGHAFSVYAYKEIPDFVGEVSTKVGEIRNGDDTLYDVFIEYPSDVQYDYVTYSGNMPESYEALYRGAEDIVKTLTPKGAGEFVWGAGCNGEDMYSEVINKYVAALEENWDTEKLEKEDMSPEYSAVNVATGGDAINNIGYVYYDTNNDGIDELLIGEIAEGDLKGIVYDIYTMVDREPVHVLSGSAQDRYYVVDNGLIVNERSIDDDTEWQSFDIESNTTNLCPQIGIKIDENEDKDGKWFANYGCENEWENISEEEFDDYKSIFEYIRFDYTPMAKAS
ncbi:MAG: haloacid dehalogenase-like hydrolase [Lachnospiraceae bacterium]|nr:haloacid dehalogenase-like hydrolase [Lachnospiraceae bacterium]